MKFLKEKQLENNMNDVFALPHPMEMCANDTKVAVALLKNPVKMERQQQNTDSIHACSKTRRTERF